jgi:hypothetical protein
VRNRFAQDARDGSVRTACEPRALRSVGRESAVAGTLEPKLFDCQNREGHPVGETHLFKI